jgi:hypothetical protein
VEAEVEVSTRKTTTVKAGSGRRSAQRQT